MPPPTQSPREQRECRQPDPLRAVVEAANAPSNGRPAFNRARPCRCAPRRRGVRGSGAASWRAARARWAKTTTPWPATGASKGRMEQGKGSDPGRAAARAVQRVVVLARPALLVGRRRARRTRRRRRARSSAVVSFGIEMRGMAHDAPRGPARRTSASASPPPRLRSAAPTSFRAAPPPRRPVPRHHCRRPRGSRRRAPAPCRRLRQSGATKASASPSCRSNSSPRSRPARYWRITSAWFLVVLVEEGGRLP
jgi:hypothetical protein